MAQKLSFILLVLILNLAMLSSAYSQIEGIPYIRNYTKQEMGAGTQTWAITSDHNGFLYLGNHEGIVKFDGSRWDIIAQLDNRSPVMSLAYGSDSILYCGGDNEIGYYKNSTNKYVSIKDSVIPDDIGLVWQIIVIKKTIWFITGNSIISFSNGKASILDLDWDVYRAFKIGNELIAHKRHNGIYKVSDTLSLIDNSEFFAEKKVKCIFQGSKESLLIGTKNHGLFNFDNEAIAIQKPISEKLKKSLLIGATSYSNGYIFGTIHDGIIITDKELNIVHNINEKYGLYRNTIYSLYIDHNENLWVGFGQGLSRVSLGSPIGFIDHRMGLNDAVYSSAIYNNKLYVGTNTKLYVTNLPISNNNDNRFKVFTNEVTGVYDLMVFDNTLFIACHDGIFSLRDNELSQISDRGCGNIQIYRQDPNKLLIGCYSGFHLVEKKSGIYEASKIPGFDKYAFHFIQTAEEDIWVTYKFKETDHLSLSGDSLSLIHKYDNIHELPHARVFDIWGEVMFCTSNGIYFYDNETDSIIPHKELNRITGGTFNGIIFEKGDDEIWLVDKEKLMSVIRSQNQFILKTLPLSMISHEMMTDREHIKNFDDIYLIGKENGICVYNTTVVERSKSFETIITKITDITDKANLVYSCDQPNNNLGFSYDHNSLKFDFTSAFYEGSDRTLYSYVLEGFQTEWSEWSKLTETNFTSLPPGHYTFRVRARNIFGQESPSNAIEFVIKSPWYLKTGMFFIYALIIIGLIIIGYRYTKKLAGKKYQNALKEKENELIRIRNQKLRDELTEKEKEMSTAALDLIQKNDDLSKMKLTLESISDNIEGKSAREINKVIKSIDVSNDRNQDQFELHFNQIHNDFIKILTKQYTELTARDIKLCAYLKLNLDTKEIASILGLSVRGVEASRYRVRKKMGLGSDVNLNEFMMKL